MRKAVKGKTPISNFRVLKRKRRPSRGFSLIELLIVLTLLVGLLTLVPAFFSKGISTAELKSSARLISSGLRAVRSQAVARNAESVFLLDVEQRQFFVGENGPVTELPEKLHLQLNTAKSEQRTDAVGGIRFFPDGSSTGGEIIASNQSDKLKVAVNWISGKVAIFDLDAE